MRDLRGQRGELRPLTQFGVTRLECVEIVSHHQVLQRLSAARGNCRLLVRVNASKQRRLAALAAERELRSGIDDLGVAGGSALLLERVRAVLFGLRILGALANRNLILRKQDIEPSPLTAKEAVDAQPRAMLGARVLLPQIIVEEHDAANLQQR